MNWPDQTSAVWTDAVGVYSAVKLLRRVRKKVVFLKKILRVVVDFDEEL